MPWGITALAVIALPFLWLTIWSHRNIHRLIISHYYTLSAFTHWQKMRQVHAYNTRLKSAVGDTAQQKVTDEQRPYCEAWEKYGILYPARFIGMLGTGLFLMLIIAQLAQ